jgi:acyl-CoA synthetase (AMP-forming)/AMP-acid ligase II
MVPARIELRDTLPTTPNGKVDRRALAEQAAATAAAR